MQMMTQEFIAAGLLAALGKHRLGRITVIQSFKIVQTAAGFDIRDGFNVKNEDVHRGSGTGKCSVIAPRQLFRTLLYLLRPCSRALLYHLHPCKCPGISSIHYVHADKSGKVCDYLSSYQFFTPVFWLLYSEFFFSIIFDQISL